MMDWIVSSSILLLTVLALRAVLGAWISKRARYALWLAAAARLLIPVQLAGLSLPWTASDLAPELPSLSQRPLSPKTAAARADVPIEAALEEGYVLLEDGSIFTSRSQCLPVLSEDGSVVMVYQGGFTVDDAVRAGLTTLWLAGGAAVLLAALLSNRSLSRRLRARRRPTAAENAPIPVYVAEGLPSPCLFGLLRPAVYLTPEAAEDERIRPNALAHELTHYAHRDHIWAAVRCLILALHWYNPLVWLAVILSKRDGELACDEGAVARLGEEGRLDYGRTLVDMVAQRPVRPADLLSCSTAMNGGGGTVRQRVLQIVKKPQTRRTALFAAVALTAAAMAFAFGSRGPIDSCEEFRRQVNAAQSIQYHGLPTNSYGYPAITDPDLLEQTRELLLQAEEYDLGAPQTDFGFQDTAPHSHQLYLFQGEDAREYYLYPMEDGPLYVLSFADDTRAGAVPLAVLPRSSLSQLRSLAERQGGRLRSGGFKIEDPALLAAVLERLAEDQQFLAENTRLWETTEEEILRWVTGEGNSPRTVWAAVEHSDLDIPELQEAAPCWTLTCWDEENPTYVFYLPDAAAREIEAYASKRVHPIRDAS